MKEGEMVGDSGLGEGLGVCVGAKEGGDVGERSGGSEPWPCCGHY